MFERDLKNLKYTYENDINYQKHIEEKEGRDIFQDYTEILNPSRPTPQLYQFMIFQKIL